MLQMHPISRPIAQIASAALLVAATLGCSAKYAQIPPRMDLQRYGRVAIVTFDGVGADTAFVQLATHRFAEEMLAAQPGIEILELDEQDPLVRAYRQSGDAGALAAALDRDKDVAGLFLGQLKLSAIAPVVKLSASTIRGRATVTADLAVRMLATRSGGTVWRSSFTGTSSVGNVSLRRGLPSIAVRDPEEAYGEIVRVLAGGVTRDFRPTLVRQ